MPFLESGDLCYSPKNKDDLMRISQGGFLMELDKEMLVNLICKCCDFYKDSDKDLECGAYKILQGLLEKGRITPKDVQDATPK